MAGMTWTLVMLDHHSSGGWSIRICDIEVYHQLAFRRSPDGLLPLQITSPFAAWRSLKPPSHVFPLFPGGGQSGRRVLHQLLPLMTHSRWFSPHILPTRCDVVYCGSPDRESEDCKDVWTFFCCLTMIMKRESCAEVVSGGDVVAVEEQLFLSALCRGHIWISAWSVGMTSQRAVCSSIHTVNQSESRAEQPLPWRQHSINLKYNLLPFRQR